MKLKLYTLLCLFLFAMTSHSLQAQLINGDMESWTADVPDGWTTIEDGITLSEENTIVHGGNAAASINVTTDTQGSTDFRQTINVIAGATYDVSFWVYHTDGGVRARMYVETFQEYTDPTITGQWQELTLSYEATTSGEIEVGLRFYDVSPNFDGEEILYVDDYTFTEVVTTEPAIVITAPSEGAVLTSGDFDMTMVVQNFVVGNISGVDGFVRYSLDGVAITDLFTTDPIPVMGLTNGDYVAVLELVDNAGMSLSTPATDTVNFTVAIPDVTEVATIAELRAGTQGEAYKLTGEAILTYQQTFRNQKYIQDATAGILIDDNPGTITSTYAVNDGITDMIGTLGEFGGMLQFVPLSDPGDATSSNNTIPMQVVTIDDLINNFEDHEAEVVTLAEASFVDPNFTFENGTVYPISDATGTYNFRTTFFNVDYIGTNANVGIGGMSGIPNSRLDGPYFSARNFSDFLLEVAVENLDITNFSLSPNPNQGSFAIQNEGVSGEYEFVIYDVLGKIVDQQQFYLNDREIKQIDANVKGSGLYLVQLINQDQKFVRTLRMVIE